MAPEILDGLIEGPKMGRIRRRDELQNSWGMGRGNIFFFFFFLRDFIFKKTLTLVTTLSGYC